MLLAFYENFSPDDLICKVIRAGKELRIGEGASVQFNADRCVRSAGLTTWELTHRGVVTVGSGISRARLVAAIATTAASASEELGGLDRWPVIIGRTSDLPTLIDRLFLYAYCIEQAKRYIRGEKTLSPLSKA